MSRAHERAYALLAERVRLEDRSRRALYAALAALIGTGAWWLVVHYAESEDLARLAREAIALKLHGAAAFVTLFALGAMSASHARRGWALERNRSSGSVLIAAFALLTATGYALYYLVDDATRPPVSLLHWIAGVALAPLVLAHIVAGRRSRPSLKAAPEARGSSVSAKHHPS